jgi:TonB family protein
MTFEPQANYLYGLLSSVCHQMPSRTLERRGGSPIYPRRVTGWVLVCLAAVGYATAPVRREPAPQEIVAVSDCPRTWWPAPAPRAPVAGSDRSPPLDTKDPRTRGYFDEIKRRIFAVWVYPEAAADQNQSGSGEVVFLVKQDGRIGKVDVVRSTGTAVLDQYMANAIRLAAPFPPLPCRITEEAIPVTLSFEYFLGKPTRGFLP